MTAETIQSVPHGFIKTFLDNLEAEFNLFSRNSTSKRPLRSFGRLVVDG